VIVERNLQIVRSNLDRLDRFFAAHEDLFVWQRPKAGPIAFPKLLRGSVDEFCRDLLNKTGVLLLPGTIYESGQNSFRIGFGRRNLPESLEKFEEYIQR
jgi:aspartate/methionine/tyrosine aminotransferase